MKFYLIPVILFLAIFRVYAQDGDNPGWTHAVARPLEELVEAVGSMPIASASAPEEDTSVQNRSLAEQESPAMQSLVTPPTTAGGNVADEITSDIAELARGLRYDPVLIYAFVRNHIDFVPYFGCKKGAHLTLSEMSGNDTDQSALLVALLRASGYSPSYRSGPVAFSANQHILWHGISTNPYGYISDPDFASIIGTTTSDPNLYNERMYYGLTAYLGAFGYPIVQRVDVEGTRFFGVPHVWVEVEVAGTTYQLSPSFKQYDWIPGIDLVTATGFDKTALLNAANPGDASDANGTTWVSDLKYDAIGSLLSTYTTNFNNYIRANKDLIGPDEIFSRKKLVQKPILTLADADPFLIFSAPWAAGPTGTWTKTAIPEDRMSTLTVTAGTYNSGTSSFSTTLFNQPVSLPALKGRKLSLAFAGNTSTFRLDESLLGSAFTLSSATTDVRLALTHDNYQWSFSGGTWSKTATTRNNRSYIQSYKKGNGYAYAFPYSFDDPQKLLRARQEVLAKYKRAGKTDTDWEVRTELLNVMGLEWYSQSWRSRRVFASLDNGVSFYVHRFGRVAQEGSYYIDVFGDRSANQHRGQFDVYSNDIAYSSALFDSAMEHGVIEQLQGPDAQAVSTVKAIYKANEDNTRIYRATSANWASISSQFTGYNNLAAIGSAVGAGAVALLPKSGDIVLGGWTGEGYATEMPGLVEMKISSLNGGYSVIPGDAGSVTIVLWGNSDPSYDSTAGNVLDVPYTPNMTPQQASADPVDLFSGAFFIDETDMSLSGSGPLGLDFTRHYNSHLRHENSAGLGYGWSDGNLARITERSSTRASLCETNTYQAAPFVVAALAQGVVHFQHSTAKEWATAALVAKWGVDQMKYNAASVTVGNTSMEFVKMPDGSFVPPPGVSASLVKNFDSSYTLSKRHGDVLNFDSEGKLTAITNQNGKSKAFGYSGDRLSTVTDAFSRVLTYTWSDGLIESVSDGTRSISFGYDSGNLVSYTDPETKTWTYQYDADRRMESRKDPENRMVIKNFYDSQNRVKAQHSMGDPDREWIFTWSGFINVEEDPYGNLTAYAYDGRGRSIVVTNPLNESRTMLYDGQDRIYYTATPKGDETFSVWDPDNNMVGTLDPENELTLFFYDSALRLETLVDKRGHDTTYTYTNSHQVETVTDPLLNVTSYTYTDFGQVETVTDGELKTTTYGYDNWGGVNSITFHDQTSSSSTNSIQGDVLTSTDADLRTVTNTWNGRRQLKTTTLPSIPGQPAAVTTYAYDDSGNLESVTDAKAHVTSYTYNSLGNKVTTTFPALPTGTNVLTNLYDFRDILTSTTNSLTHLTSFEYNEGKRLEASVDPLLRRTERFYDANGQLEKVIDPLLRETETEWTARGQKDNDTNGLNKTAHFRYDANGNQDQFTNRRGKLYQFGFDDANRPTSTITPTLKSTSTTYYDNDLVKTITEPSTQVTTFLYNDRNLTESRNDPSGMVSYAYYDSGLPHTTTEGSNVITRTYDERGRLKSYKLVESGVEQFIIQYRYDANGNLERLTYPDGEHVHYTYNSRNQLRTVTDWRAAPNNTTTYNYDQLGRLTGVTRPNGTSNLIAHDDAGQILNVKESANGKLISFLDFGYDDAGQIKRRFRAPMVNASWSHPSVAATYDDDNRLLTVNGGTVVHDPDGNLTNGPIRENSGSLLLSYNSRNQLESADGFSYTYDAEGNRRSMSGPEGPTKFVVDPGSDLSRLLVKLNPDGSKTRYVYGLGLLYEIDEAEATKTHHFNQVGSTILRTDDFGQVIGQAEYSAFGLITSRSGDLNTPFLYNGSAGVHTDPNGLLHMRARYYSPYLMRFLNPDPIGFSGGSNWFAYANGNPISLNDPFGLCATSGNGFWDSLAGIAQAQWNNLNSAAAFIDDGALNAAAGTAYGALWIGDQMHHVVNGSWSSLGSSQSTEGINPTPNYYGNQGYYNPDGSAAALRDATVAAAMITYGVAPTSRIGGALGAESQLVTVSRWGREGLEAGDWVMKGPVSMSTFTRSFKWDPNPTNVRVPFKDWGTGQQYQVPKYSLNWPQGWEKFKGVFGQRTYDP